MKYIFFIAIIVLASLAYTSHLPKPLGYVNDFAGILTDTQVLENELRLYEQNTTIEIALITIESLPPDQTLFSYGVELFEEWKIGKKGEDNGLLILIVENGTVGNRLRIELGYGVQGYVTGAEAGNILDAVLPYYEKDDYQTAVEIILAGLSDELVNYVPGEIRKPWLTTENVELMLNAFLIVFFVIIPIISIILRNRCPYCFGKLKCYQDHCTCTKCGRKITRRKRYAPVLIGGGFRSGGGGFGGFGGGGSGGGGAGR